MSELWVWFMCMTAGLLARSLRASYQKHHDLRWISVPIDFLLSLYWFLVNIAEYFQVITHRPSCYSELYLWHWQCRYKSHKEIETTDVNINTMSKIVIYLKKVGQTRLKYGILLLRVSARLCHPQGIHTTNLKLAKMWQITWVD